METKVVDRVDAIYAIQLWGWKVEGDEMVFRSTHYKFLKTMCDLVQYENWFVIETKKLCDVLDVDHSNLYKMLRNHSHLVKYENYVRGYMKIYVNPAYYFVHESAAVRDEFIYDWYSSISADDLFRDYYFRKLVECAIEPF